MFIEEGFYGVWVVGTGLPGGSTRAECPEAGRRGRSLGYRLRRSTSPPHCFCPSSTTSSYDSSGYQILILISQAEVLSGLLYKLRNSPPDRFACLVAEVRTGDGDELVGVVDMTVQRDEEVMRHLRSGEDEYLYVSGIAVSQSFRWRKVATALLEACDVFSTLLGYAHLALRAYEDDAGARRLYSNAGYEVVGEDPQWVGLGGRKRRVVMIKESVLIKGIGQMF